VSLKNYCFTINSYHQAAEVITIFKKNKIVPVLYIKYYLINGLGMDWLNELKNMLLREFKSNDFKTYIDVRKNYGLFISLVEQKINFIKIQANQDILKRLGQIGKLNKVLINPNFSVIDLSKSKNLRTKLKNYIIKYNS